MTQPAKSQEPSMEEILASIRRIIADEEPAPPQPEAAAAAAPLREVPREAPREATPEPLRQVAASEPPAKAPEKPDTEPDVFDLTPSMEAPASPPPFRTIDGSPDLVFEDRGPRVVRDEKPADPVDSMVDDVLMSPRTKAAVNSAFNSLAQTVLVQNARSLEDLVREMLRPMLRTWIDENLPDLVERLVRAEIERVSRG